MACLANSNVELYFAAWQWEGQEWPLQDNGCIVRTAEKSIGLYHSVVLVCRTRFKFRENIFLQDDIAYDQVPLGARRFFASAATGSCNKKSKTYRWVREFLCLSVFNKKWNKTGWLDVKLLSILLSSLRGKLSLFVGTSVKISTTGTTTIRRETPWTIM